MANLISIFGLFLFMLSPALIPGVFHLCGYFLDRSARWRADSAVSRAADRGRRENTRPAAPCEPALPRRHRAARGTPFGRLEPDTAR